MVMDEFIFDIQRFDDSVDDTTESSGSEDTVGVTLYNNVNDTLISGTKFDDYINNVGKNVSIYSGAGNDTVYNSVVIGNNETIYSDDSMVDASAGDNYIRNYSKNVTIKTGGGADTISNEGGNVSINTGDGADSIKNYGENVTINAGGGDNHINIGSYYQSVGSAVFVESGSGKDYIYNYFSNVTINSGAGNDTISDSGNNLYVDSGDGSDEIAGPGNGSTIIAGTGNDTIYSYGDKSSINAGEGIDYIYSGNDYSNVSIDAGRGNDTIYVGKSGTIFYQKGYDNDVIFNYNSDNTIHLTDGSISSFELDGSDVIFKIGVSGSIRVKESAYNPIVVKDSEGNVTSKIYATEGTSSNDSINNYNDKTTIATGAGNDTVYNSGNQVTITSTGGNNYVNNYGGKALISVDGGSNYIYNYGSDTTIISGTGNDSINNESAGKNVVINGGDGTDSITNWSDQVTIYGGAGADSIYNNSSLSGVFIDAGEDNDTIQNWSSQTTVMGGAGDDSIFNDTYLGTGFVDGGEGNDTIEHQSGQVTIYGGNGNDSIRSRGDNSSVNGGAGDDTISSGGDNASVNGGDGNDSISSGGDNASINGGAGDDIIFNYSCDNVTLTGGAGNDTLIGNNYKTEVFQYSGGNDVITNYSGEDILHFATGSADNYSFDGEDLVFNLTEGTVRLKGMKNHAITVKDSSGRNSTNFYGTVNSTQSIIKNFTSAIRNGSSVDEAIKACSGFNSLQEVIDKMVADCQSVSNSDTFLHDYCGIIDNNDSGSFTGWDAGGLEMKTTSDLLPKSGSASYPTSNTFSLGGLTITVPDQSTLSQQEQLIVKGFYSWWGTAAKDLIEDTYGVSLNGQSIPLSFYNEPNAFEWGYGGSSGIRVNMGKDASKNITEEKIHYSGFDTLFSHEMTHVMQYTVGKMYDLPNYMIEGMADLTAGDDNNEFESLAGNASTLKSYLNPYNSYSHNSKIYAAGVMFWRYLMKHAFSADEVEPDPGTGTTPTNPTNPSTDTTPTNPSTDTSTDTIKTPTNPGTETTTHPTDPGTGTGTSSSTTVVSSILTAQNGIYNYTSGTKKIENYQPSERVRLNNGFNHVEYSGNDIVLKYGNETLTLQNSRERLIDFIDSGGKTIAYGFMSGNGGEVAANALGNHPETFKVLIGSGGVNHLIAGNGGSSLIGGVTDDTLEGGTGQDTFVYSSGNDAIINFGSWEKVNFAANYTGWFTYDNALYINSDKGALKISDARDKMIEVADGDGNLLTHVIMQNGEGTFEGRTFDQYVVAVGADNLTNQLLAGNAGSSLWGGGGNMPDDMYGGAGTDEFIYNYGNGQDNIFNAGIEDIVNLNGTNLDVISHRVITDNGVIFSFTDGGSLNVQGQAERFYIGGQVFRADYQNKSLTAE